MIYSYMDELKIFAANYQARQLTPLEIQAGNNVFANSLNAKKSEKILVVCDEAKLAQEAAVFFQAAKNFSDQVIMAVIPPSHHHGEEPPEELVSLMCQQNIVLLVTTYSLSHTIGRHKACDAGARVVSMPGITGEIITRTLVVDYNEVSRLTKHVAGLLTMADSAKITSPNGTAITLSLRGRNAIADTGLILNPRDFGNLPAGEAFLAPVKGGSNGQILFDGAFADILIDEPISVTVENGQATKIEGGSGAKQLEITLNSLGEDSRNIAELGVGTNKTAKLESAVLEVEKVYGTVHIALGNNKHFGGEVDVQYHADGVILAPTLELDGKLVLKDGEFIL